MSKTYGNKSALKHGAFTDVVILPGEDPNELKNSAPRCMTNGTLRDLPKSIR